MVTGKHRTKIEEGLDFILSHFPNEEPKWPRKISTRATGNKQILVNTSAEGLARFKAANYLDCKINAYRWREDWAIKLLGQAPQNIFIDVDEHDFKSKRAFGLAVHRTLKNFNKKLHNASPTILHSGNGYHFIQPVDGLILEHYELFGKVCENPSDRFHRFAERLLTNNKSDPAHNPTFLSCMLRIPGSINSRNMTEVKIIHIWDRIRPDIRPLLPEFYIYLADAKVKEIQQPKKVEQRRITTNGHSRTNNKIGWIESLLQTPIADNRKFALWRILAPYLVNIRKLSYEEAFNVTKGWLQQCNTTTRLDFNPNDRIKENLNAALKRGYLPISFENLRIANKALHHLLGG